MIRKWEATAGNCYAPQSRSPPYPQGYVPRPSWMLETVDSTEPYIYHDFSYTFIPMIKINL